MYPQYLTQIADPDVRARIRIERKIVLRLIETLLAAGYELAVYDGEEYHPWTTSQSDVLRDIMNTDEDVLRVRKPGEAWSAFVLLVYGNDGWDVICDYNTSLEDVLAPVNAYADSLGEGA
jgi:hypothetical protein